MSQIAKDTGLGRESLYKTFHQGSKPKFDTIVKVLNSLGVKIRLDLIYKLYRDSVTLSHIPIVVLISFELI